MKLIIALFTIITASIVSLAQPSYNGGPYDGHAMAEWHANEGFLFSGGDSDGYSSHILLSGEDFLFSGSDGDGYANALQEITEDFLFNGRDDDGYACYFLYEDLIWTGATGEGWNVAGNWNLNIKPNLERRTIIPPGVPNNPFVNAGILAIAKNPNSGAFESGYLWVQAGATMTTRINNLVENYGTMLIDGTLNMLNGSETALQHLEGSIHISTTGILDNKGGYSNSLGALLDLDLGGQFFIFNP